MWKLKVLIQWMLSRLPGGQVVNDFLQDIRKSHDSAWTAERTVALAKEMVRIREYHALDGIRVMEIGTGWEPICPIMFCLMGAQRVHTYDHVRHLRLALTGFTADSMAKVLGQVSQITGVAEHVMRERLEKFHPRTGDTLETTLQRGGIHYHAPSNAGTTGLPDKSIDLVYSHAVLQHVPREAMPFLLAESKRILKPEGLACHAIYLHDNFVSIDPRLTKVNFLRYSEKWWSFFVHNRITYLNRLREKHYLDLFEKAGATVLWRDNKVDPRDVEALKSMKVDDLFKGLSLEELAVYKSDVILSFGVRGGPHA